MGDDLGEIEVASDGEDLYVLLDGIRIAKRGKPGTPQAEKWIPLVSGYVVLDGDADCPRLRVERIESKH